MLLQLRALLILIPFSFFLSCAVPFVDRSGGHPKLYSVDWKYRNAIIVLGMRTERSGDAIVLPKLAELRVREAVRLYRECTAAKKECFVIPSGGDPANNKVTEAELMKKEFLKNAIPEKDILLEDKSVSTFHNAKYTADLLEKVAPNLTILVTSDAHLPRALKMFKIFGVLPLPAPAEHEENSVPKR